MPELKEVFEMVSQKVEPDMDAWRRQDERHRRFARNRRIGAFAVTTAIAVAAVAVILGTREESDQTKVGTDVPPTAESQERVVTSSNFLVPLEVTVPASWTRVIDRDETFIAFDPLPSDENAPSVGIDVLLVENVYRDPCLGPEGGLLDPPLGRSPRALIDHLRGIPQLHASRVEVVTVGGRSGLAIEEGMRSQGRCQGGVAVWPMEDGEPYVIFEGEHKWIVVLDIDGRRVVVALVTPDGSWDALSPEAKEVLGSLRFGA